MASRQLQIAATVKDAASAKLRQIQENLGKTGSSAKKAGLDFTEFNRTMFATTAYVGLFTGAMFKLSSAMLEAAKFSRVQDQFERVVGPKGELIKNIREMTDNSIDAVEAMRSGIALGSLGVAKDSRHIAELIARAGTAAKMAGIDSGEGIKHFTQFMKDGSVTHLEFLNLIASSNPQLQLQLSAIKKYTGVAGGALSAQMKLALGQSLLNAATATGLKGQRDIADTLQDVSQYTKMAGREISMFVAQAAQPFLEKLTLGSMKLMFFLENLRKTSPELLFLVKSLGAATAGLAALIASVGFIRLLAKSFTFLGLSMPLLTGGILGLALAFVGLTAKTDGFVNKLKVFGSIFKGVYELVTSHFKPENYAKGIGVMSKATRDMLEKNGLLSLVETVSKGIIVVSEFSTGLYSGFVGTMTKIREVIGNVIHSILTLFGIKSDKWASGIKDSARSIGKTLGALLPFIVAFMGLSSAKGLLGKLPGFGKLGGGKGSGPKGSKNDPIYTKSAEGVSDALKGFVATGSIFGGLKGIFSKEGMKKVFAFLPAAFKLLKAPFTKKLTPAGLESFKFSRKLGVPADIALKIAREAKGGSVNVIADKLAGITDRIGKVLGSGAKAGSTSFIGSSLGMLSKLGQAAFVVTTAFAALSGIVQGVYRSLDGFKKLFGQGWELTKGLASVTGDYLKNAFISAKDAMIEAVQGAMGYLKEKVDWLMENIPGMKQLAKGAKYIASEEAAEDTAALVAKMTGGPGFLSSVAGTFVSTMQQIPKSALKFATGDTSELTEGYKIGGKALGAGAAAAGGFLSDASTNLAKFQMSKGQLPSLKGAGLNEQEKVAQLQSLVADMDDSKKATMKAAMVKAQAESSASGASISAEEYQNILREVLGMPLLAIADNTKETAENGKVARNNNVRRNNGC